MGVYKTPIDIANRAITHCRRDHIEAFTDQSEEAHETEFVYDKLREAELRRNTWRFAIRRNILRAVGIDTQIWTPPTYAAGTTYAFGEIVIDSDGEIWSSKVSSNTGHTPSAGSAYWRRYFGQVAADLYDSNNTYFSGEIVIVPAAWSGATTYAANDVVRSGTTWYVSLAGSNLNNAVTDTAWWAVWSSTGRSSTTFGETASGAPIPLTLPGTPAIYRCLYDGNTDNPVSATGNWRAVNGTLAQLAVLYPIGAGPSQQSGTANFFRLPFGFLRRAPDDTRGVNPSLGAPAGPIASDEVMENLYIVSSDPGPVMLRYVADTVDVDEFDAMFCEGLAARMAEEVAITLAKPELLQVILSNVARQYRSTMYQARVVNGIETGPTEPVEDDYVTCRG